MNNESFPWDLEHVALSELPPLVLVPRSGTEFGKSSLSGGRETGQIVDLRVHARWQCHLLHDKRPCKVYVSCLRA